MKKVLFMFLIIIVFVCKQITFAEDKVSGYSVVGTGMVTTKPDNVSVQFLVKSSPQATLKLADTIVTERVGWMIYNISRIYNIKKENIIIYDFPSERVKESARKSKHLIRKNDDNNSAGEDDFRYISKKYVVVGDLGSKSFVEICEMLDKAVDYGGIAVAEIPKLNNEVAPATAEGKADSRLKVVNGATKLKFAATTQNPDNQLINYHFNEATLEKLMKTAKDQAYKEAKDKVDKIKAVLKFKENEVDIIFAESTTAASDEEGAVTIKTEVTATLNTINNSIAESFIQTAENIIVSDKKDTNERILDVNKNINNLSEDTVEKLQKNELKTVKTPFEIFLKYGKDINAINWVGTLGWGEDYGAIKKWYLQKNIFCAGKKAIDLQNNNGLTEFFSEFDLKSDLIHYLQCQRGMVSL